VTQAFIGLGERAGAIDTAQLAKAFDTIAATFKDTPPYVHRSLVGCSGCSTSIASRDAQPPRCCAQTAQTLPTERGRSSRRATYAPSYIA